MVITREHIRIFTKENVRSFVAAYNKAVKEEAYFFTWDNGNTYTTGKLMGTGTGTIKFLVAAGFMTGEFNDDNTFTIHTQT